jgi:hypothetical protein
MATGPACPTETRAQYLASGPRASETFTYHGVRFSRAYGYVNCNEVTPDLLGVRHAKVCQFNSPTVLEVTTPSADVYYAAPVSPMTAWVDESGPHCDLASSVRM